MSTRFIFHLLQHAYSLKSANKARFITLFQQVLIPFGQKMRRLMGPCETTRPRFKLGGLGNRGGSQGEAA